MQLLTLEDARTRVRIVPELGAGIASLEALTPAGPIDVLRSWDGSAAPFALGCNLLVPFSNRISGGGFRFEGTFHEVPANLAGEPFPIHGDGFQRPWSVTHAGPRAVTLTLAEGQIGPWHYAAALTVGLRDGALEVTLYIRNRSGRRLPFGGGFHPWFPRHPTTRLAFAATGLWLEDERHLPLRHLAIADVPELDFRRNRPLPVTWVNNAFTGWDRRAEIQQPGLSLHLTASDVLTTAVIYSPDASAAFFCAEPVSHPVDAHNLPGMPGLMGLDDGAEIHLAMALLWRDRP